jgi:cell division transport system permease protein
MSAKLFKKYSYDIALDEGVGAHLVSLVTGLMVFFVTLALVVNLGLSTITKNWVSGLSGTLTVEIKPPLAPAEGGKPPEREQARFDSSVQQILTLLKGSADVSESRLLTSDEIKKLIEPWMGQSATLDAIPLPALFDIKLVKNADASHLQSEIKLIAPSATVDTHTDTLDDVKSLVNTASLFVFLLTGVIVLLAVVAISGIVRAKLLIHQPEVETLHLIGASDEYIASQFRQHTLRGTLKGSLAGLVCTFATLLVISSITRTLNTDILSSLQLMPLQWVMLIVSPLAIGSLIAHLTAQATVLKELSRLP